MSWKDILKISEDVENKKRNAIEELVRGELQWILNEEEYEGSLSDLKLKLKGHPQLQYFNKGKDDIFWLDEKDYPTKAELDNWIDSSDFDKWLGGPNSDLAWWLDEVDR